MKFLRCNSGIVMQSHRPCWTQYQREWKHPSSPRPKKVHPAQCAVKVMFIVAYGGVILHHAVPPRQMVNSAPSSSAQEKMTLSGTRTPSLFMTGHGVIPLLLSRTSCATVNGRFWNIHSTHSITVHAITISSPKNHCEGFCTTHETNLSVLLGGQLEHQQ